MTEKKLIDKSTTIAAYRNGTIPTFSTSKTTDNRTTQSKHDFSSNNQHYNPKTIDDFCDTFISALQEEYAFLSANNRKTCQLSNGKLIQNRLNRFYYIFESETELSLIDGIDIQISYDSKKCTGNIITCRDFTVTLVSNDYLGTERSSIKITADSRILLKKLSERLKDTVQPSKFAIVGALVCDSDGMICDISPHTGQDNALQMSLNQPITFIWGPPGTGKQQH